jgi:iron complex outermembrane receptor protein
VSPPSFGAPATGIPDPPDADKNFAQPWTYTDEQQLFGVVRAEYDFTRAVSAWAAIGGRNGDEKNVLANPTFDDANPDTTANRFDNAREDDVISGEIGVRFNFDTGPIGHRVIASASLFSFDSKNAFTFYFAPLPSDLEHPIDQPKPDASGGVFPGGDLDHPLKTLTTDTSSIALADVLSFADGKFMLTLGARDQKIEGETFVYQTGARQSKYDDSKTTPIGGIVFRPSDTLSLFANYIEGLVAGDVAPTLTPAGDPVVNGGEAQPPYTAEQLEAGIKYDSGKFGVTLSLFEISKAFGRLELADDPNTTPTEYAYRADGEQRNRGAEFGFFGEPVDGFRVIGGVTWLDAEIEKTDNASLKGKVPIGAPRTQANVNVEWDVPVLQGLTLEARALDTSSQFIDGANDLELDSWVRYDLGARYATEIAGRPFSVRARIDNVTNENDWISAGGYPGFGYMVLGAPRTYVVSTSFDF